MPSSKDAQPASVRDVLKKAEQRYKQAHPFASVGNDVSAITRGELVAVLEELVTTLAGGGEVRLEKDEKAIGGLLEGARKLSQDLGLVAKGMTDLAARVAALEAKGAPKPAKPAKADAAAVDTSGSDKILALGRAAMEDFAKTNNIDISGFGNAADDVLAEFIAANMNLKS